MRDRILLTLLFGMTSNLTSPRPTDPSAILNQAAAAVGTTNPRPTAHEVVTALLEAEATAKRQRATYPLEALLGTWRLCLATGTRKAQKRGGIRLGRGFYMPILTPAHISFALDETRDRTGAAQITNQLQLGTVKLKFTGPACYLGKKNLLAFDFTHLQVTLFGKTVFDKAIRSGKQPALPFDERPVSQLPFFSFFQVTDGWIAARGRGGGLALWAKQPTPDQ